MAFPTLTVLDSDEAERTINTFPNAGRVAAADSMPAALSTEDKAALDAISTALGLIGGYLDTEVAAILAKIAAAGTAGSASANVLSVQGIASGTNLPVVSNNSEVKLSVSFTRPANTTAYAAGDLVANDTTAGSVAALTFTNAVRTAGDCVRIDRARVAKTGTTLTNASFRLHLFETIPVPSVGDNAAFNSSGALSTTGGLVYVGSIAVTMDIGGSDGGSGRGVPSTGSAMTICPTSGTSIFGLLEATAAYTPASGETFTVILEGFRT